MAFDEVILLLCGNFNPISNTHLRLFEIAKDHLADHGYTVYKGVLSLFEESNSEDDVVSLDHRVTMIKYALSSSDWIQLSTWHCKRRDITCIAKTLQQHQTNYSFRSKGSVEEDSRTSMDIDPKPCRLSVKLLCGADILVFLNNSNFNNEMQEILQNHGIVVMSRDGFDVDSIINENDFLWTHRKNIIIIRERVENEITTCKIRKAASRGRSVKYLVSDAVERYICLHNLYVTPNCEYKHLNNKCVDITTYEAVDSFQDFTWCSHSKCGSSSETLTSTTAKKSKLSYKSKAIRVKKDAHFKDVDRSKLIEIPLTEDGVIQIIADRETNL